MYLWVCACVNKQGRAKYVGLAELVVGIVPTEYPIQEHKAGILTQLGLPQKSKLELWEQHVAVAVTVVAAAKLLTNKFSCRVHKKL